MGLGCSLCLSDNVVAIATVPQSYDSIDDSFEQLYFLKLTYSTCFLHRRQLNSDIMLFLIDLEVDDRAAVHLVFEVILCHESGDEVPEVILGDSYFIWDVGDH